jgi:hypothetical protein
VRFRKLIKRVVFCALIVCMVPIFSSMAMGELITHFAVSDVALTDSNPSISTFGTGASFSGDSLLFPNFLLNSSLSGVTATSEVALTITANSGSLIDALDFGEGGNCGFFSPDPSATSELQVKSWGSLTILEGNNPGTVINLPGFDQHTTVTGVGQQLTDWGGDLNFVLAGENATKVRLTLNNSVYTSNTPGTFVFVGATSRAVALNVTAVPEPGMLTLLVMGVFGICAFCAKKYR